MKWHFPLEHFWPALVKCMQGTGELFIYGKYFPCKRSESALDESEKISPLYNVNWRRKVVLGNSAQWLESWHISALTLTRVTLAALSPFWKLPLSMSISFHGENAYQEESMNLYLLVLVAGMHLPANTWFCFSRDESQRKQIYGCWFSKIQQDVEPK